MLPAAMLFASCASRHTITANIEGLGNDTLLVEGYFFGSDGDFMDTIVVREGKFVYDLDFDFEGLHVRAVVVEVNVQLVCARLA